MSTGHCHCRLCRLTAHSSGYQGQEGHLPGQQRDANSWRPLCAPTGQGTWCQHPSRRLRALREHLPVVILLSSCYTRAAAIVSHPHRDVSMLSL